MRLALLIAVTAALALPAGAAAKEIVALDVCGTDGCTRISDRDTLRGFEDGSEEHRAFFGPGEYFGELGPILGLPRSATARATEPTRLTGLGVQAFRAKRQV